MTSGNCYLFVVSRWWTRGGYVVVRKSHYGWWLHALWSPDLATFEEFVPLWTKGPRRFPPLWFKGRIRRLRVRKGG